MNQYNHNIDKVKFFSVIAVIIIHITVVIPANGIASFTNYYFYRNLLNVAVPFFFAASGYFLSFKTEKYLKGYSKKIFSLYISFSSLYIGVKIIFILTDRLIKGTPFWPNLENIINSLSIEGFFKGNFGYFHLWYLAALFFASLILLLFVHFKVNAKVIFLFSFLFYFASIIDLFGLSKIIVYGGFPKAIFYLSMGYYAGKVKPSLKFNKILFVVYWAVYNLLGYKFAPGLLEIILALATFHLLLSCLENNGKPSFLSKLGKEYTLSIYVFHVLVYEIMYRLFVYAGFQNHYMFAGSYILVGFACIVISIALKKIIDKLIVKPTNSFIQRL